MLNKERTWIFMKYGLLVNGPLQHFAFSKVFPLFGCCKKGIACKLLFSQTVYTVFSLGLFYLVLPLLKGQTLGDSFKEIETKLWPTLITGWKLWPLVQLINFVFIPVKLQVLWVNMFGLIFNIYLSFMSFAVSGTPPRKEQTPDELQ